MRILHLGKYYPPAPGGIEAHVRTLARQLFVDERASVPVALAGGMLRRGSFLRRLVEHRLKSAVPGSHLHGEPVDAARGAVTLARRTLATA